MASTASRRAAVDMRLVLGLVLVAASVAGVVALVGAFDRRTTVYAAASALTPGDRVERADLVARSVSRDGADELYLREEDLSEGGLVVLRPVRDGELLPRTAVGDAAGVRSTAVVLRLASPVSATVTPGATVDGWASPVVDDGRGFGAPVVLVPDAIVVRIVEDDGLVASRDVGTVEVLVPRARVARVLQAQAGGDALAVVPAGLPIGG